MFGGPGQLTEEQKRAQEKYTQDNLKVAGIVAAALWITPVVLHFVRKQL